MQYDISELGERKRISKYELYSCMSVHQNYLVIWISFMNLNFCIIRLLGRKFAKIWILAAYSMYILLHGTRKIIALFILRVSVCFFRGSNSFGEKRNFFLKFLAL